MPFMTTFYDVPANVLIPNLAEKLNTFKEVCAPEWASFVKTGTHRERPPSQENWWNHRLAAVLRKVAREGPIGTVHLAQSFGGKVDRGSKPNSAGTGSRQIIRTALKQLESAGLVCKVEAKIIENSEGVKSSIYSGREITALGHKLLDEVAHEVIGDVVAIYPGIDKY